MSSFLAFYGRDIAVSAGYAALAADLAEARADEPPPSGRVVALETTLVELARDRGLLVRDP